jgi:hypothetical protein
MDEMMLKAAEEGCLVDTVTIPQELYLLPKKLRALKKYEGVDKKFDLTQEMVNSKSI